MMTRIAALAIGFATLVFLVGLAVWVWSLAATGQPLQIAAAAALGFFAVLGFWVLGYEMYFGVKAQQLGTRLEKEDGLPTETLPLHPSGRFHQEEALPIFEKYRSAVTQAPQDWRAWYRLGLVYDAAGDRSQARRAVRTAIRLARTTP